MTKEKLEHALELLLSDRYDWHDVSDFAYTAVENLLTEWVGNFDYYGPRLEEELDAFINQELETFLMYYSDTFEYLEEQRIWDIEDAVREGFGNTLGGIAYYFLQDEVYGLLSELNIR